MAAVSVDSFQSGRGEAQRDEEGAQLVHDLQKMNEPGSTNPQGTDGKSTAQNQSLPWQLAGSVALAGLAEAAWSCVCPIPLAQVACGS